MKIKQRKSWVLQLTPIEVKIYIINKELLDNQNDIRFYFSIENNVPYLKTSFMLF